MSVFSSILTFIFLWYNMKKRKNNCLGSFPLEEYSKLFNQVWFGCDYMRLCFNQDIEKFDSWLDNLDFDNSNIWYYDFWDITINYQKIKVSLWVALHFSVSYSWVAVPVFQYVKFNKQTRDLIWYSGKFDVYSSYYRLLELWFFSKNYVTYFIRAFSLEDPFITRYDFRIDFFNNYRHVDIPTPESLIDVHVQSKLEVFKQGWIITNWSVWSKESWRYLMRLYNKKLDTNKKWKWILFSDYLCFESVHRLEYQFESAFCRWFHLSDLIKLEDKIYTSLNLHNNFEGCLFYKYDSSKEINSYNKWSHIQRFKNQTNKFVKAWYNPFILMYDTIVSLYGLDSADDYFTYFLEIYDFMPKCKK